MFYLSPFLQALGVSVVFLVTATLFGRGMLHREWMKRLGGVAVVLGCMVALQLDSHLMFDRTVWYVVAALIIIGIFGLVDDRFRLTWGWQLAFQMLLASGLFFGGVAIQSVTLPWNGVTWFLHPETYWWPSLLFSVGWMLLLVNALNWTDGVDGSAGGTALVGFLAIFALSLRPDVYQPPVAIIALAAAGATLGFLFFNFPPARFIAGTSGSYFWGFLLATLAIFAGTKIATTLLVLAIPVLDALFVVGDRLMSGVSIFRGDRERHLHFRLRRLGWSDRRISLLFVTVASLAAVLALRFHATGKMILFASIAFVLLGTFLFFRRERPYRPMIKKHEYGTE